MIQSPEGTDRLHRDPSQYGGARRMLIAGVAGVAALAAAAGSYFASGESWPVAQGTVAEHTFDAGEAQLISVLKNPAIHTVSDKVLANGGYNCGHTIENANPTTFAYDNQIDFLNSKPELTKDVLNFNVNDKKFGVGEKAFHILTSQALPNTKTSGKKEISKANDNSAGDMNAYAHNIQTLQVDPPRDYLNFTCENPDGSVNVRPVSKIKVTGHVNGFKVDETTLKEFEDAIKAVGKENTLDVINLGKQKVNGKEVEIFFVVTEAQGCDNPIRLIPNHPKAPAEQTTVATTTTETSTTFGPKIVFQPNGPHTQHGAGGQPEQGMDPQNDGSDGFGPGDTKHGPKPTTPPTNPPAPGITSPRPPVTEAPVPAPTDVVTTAPDGAPPSTNLIP